MTALPDSLIDTPSRQDRPPGNALLFGLASNIRIGSLEIMTPDGSSRLFGNPGTGPAATLMVNNSRLGRRLLTGGTLGFCEAYLDGDWDSPDLSALFLLALRNEQHFNSMLDGRPWLRRLSNLFHTLRPNTRLGSRRNIAAHYDLGNEFYRHWLDASMTYSSGIYADPETTEPLEQTQERKYEALCRRLQLQPGPAYLRQ